jgi:hypothetical protein
VLLWKKCLVDTEVYTFKKYFNKLFDLRLNLQVGPHFYRKAWTSTKIGIANTNSLSCQKPVWLSVLNRNIETSRYPRISVPTPKAVKECITILKGTLKELSNENRGGSKRIFTNPTG